MNNVGNLYLQSKVYDEAAAWLARSATVSRSALGELHPFTISVQLQCAEALRKAGRKDEASELRRIANEARRTAQAASGAVVDYRDLQSGTIKSGAP